MGRLVRPLLRILLILSPFLLLEVGLHLVDYQAPENPLLRGLDGSLQVFRVQGGQRVVSPLHADAFHAAPFPVAKPEGEFRVFSVGDSITWGHAGNEVSGALSSYTDQLRKSLEQRQDPVQYRVINCGGRGFASLRVLAVFEEVLGYAPDLIVASFGSSEHLEQRTEALWRREQRLSAGWLGRYRTRQLLGAWLGRRGGSAWGLSVEQLRERNERLDSPSLAPICRQRGRQEREAAEQATRTRVQRMVELSGAAGVPLVLLTVPSHLRWPPFAGLPADARDPSSAEALLERSAALLAAARPELALELLDQALAVEPQLAALHYRRAQAMDALQRWVEAAGAYRLARDHDACPLRAPTAHSELFREQAAAHEHVRVVEAEAVLVEQVSDGIPDDRLFLDHCHPTQEGHGLLARGILQVLQQQRLLPGAAPAP